MNIFFSFLLVALPLYAQKSVKYELRFDNAAHHEATIRATFSGVTEQPLELRMSRSSPGRYALHEFAKNVYSLHPFGPAGQSLAVTHPDPSGWNVSGANGTVIVEYTLYGDRVDGTYAAIDSTHAHLNPPAALIWARGFENAPVSLSFVVPEGSNWRAATELAPEPDGTWSAPNLEQLMDSPIELSDHQQPEWKIENQTFRLALHQRGTEAEAKVFAQMCQAVVLEEEGVFGSFPKYDTGTYTFLVDYLPYASFDGMEHRDSTVISGPLTLKGDSTRDIGTVSHEFFHSWNVRRIRPKSLEPFDFDRADMSGELWFAEGFTNYYGILTLKRAGFSTLDEFASEMGPAVNAVLTAPGRLVHNVVEMSQLAPFVDAARSIDTNNFANTFISYYTYGQALALGLDLMIRQHFPGKSLDDWMRTMWREHPDINKPYTLGDLQQALGESIGDPDFARQVFDEHVYGKTPLDYSAALASAGLVLRKQHVGAVWLGARNINFADKGAEIASNTLRDSPLYKAGLDIGDRIERWDGKQIKNSSDLDSWLAKHKPGEQVSLEAETRAGKKTVTLTFSENPALEIVTFERAGQSVTPAITAVRTAWLSSKALHPLPQISAMP
ncbi:MAG TPA: PDZ domain-containing protein [Bryobacteraceae bacterium]|nr:PDZ domain-containing protein [Bryobacteraceae bacterium]